MSGPMMVRGRASDESAGESADETADETARSFEKEILIVDADLHVCETLWAPLQGAGYRPCVAPTAQHACELIAARAPLALIVDWSLPDRSGLSFLLDLRAQPRTERLPAIMLSAREDEDDCVRALAAGADDFIRKPFSLCELIARLRVLLRPAPRRLAPARILAQGLTLDVAAMRVGNSVDCGETALSLGPFECRLLRFFLTHGHRVHSRREIIHELYGSQAICHDERSIDHHVFHLRKALRALGHPTVIETVRGRGYRLTDGIEPPPLADAADAPAGVTFAAGTAAASFTAGATTPASAAR
jgi:two-component system, OmpR family, phosphate regulon response regulator PhoB